MRIVAKKVLEWLFGVLGIILGIILNIKYPLDRSPIFFSVKEMGIVIHWESNILLWSGIFCLILFCILLGSEKDE